MVVAGDIIKASDQQNGTLSTIGDIVYIRKPNTESVTSSAALQNDNDLLIALPIGVYNIRCFLHVSGLEAGDVRVAWSFSGTATIARSCFGPAEAMTDRETTLMVARGNVYTTEQVYGIDSTGATAIWEDLHFEVSVAGTLQLQWAQGTSNGTATVLSTASRMLVFRIG